MANINEILARAAALRDETSLNSIDPERAGGIMYDTLIALNELWLQQGAALVISKIYASVAAMNADTSPVSDLTGKPIRPGMIVVIASSDTDNGSVYRYNGTSAPSWSLVGKIGNLEPVDSLDSDSTQFPLAAHQGKVLDGKISQLGQKEINDVSGLFKVGKYIHADTGQETESQNHLCTGYLVVYSDIYAYGYEAGTNTGIHLVAFYDKEKRFISSYCASPSPAFIKVHLTSQDIPDGAFFFRVNSYIDIAAESFAYSKISDATTSVYDKLKFELGEFGSLVDTYETINILSQATIHKYKVYDSGDEVDFGQSLLSGLIPVTAGDIVNYKLTNLGDFAVYIACYNGNGEYVKNLSLRGVGGGGSWSQNTGTFIIPSGIVNIKISSATDYYSNDSCTLLHRVSVSEYVGSVGASNHWVGKKWCAFGTSITDSDFYDVHFLQPTGKYLPFLESMSGMIATDKGSAGNVFMTGILDIVRATDLTDYDLVTIEGAVNDHAMSKPLGQVGDITDETFAGCIYLMAKYVYENSNATLVFITDYVGRYVEMVAPDGTMFYGDCAPTKQNALGLLQIDYINMIVNQCRYFGIPVIPAGQDSGINLLTGDLYLMDHIHSSYIGGKQYAQTIYNALLNIHPRVISL